MARTKVSRGDVIFIPVGEHFALAKVLFVSSIFKKMMLMGVSVERAFSKPELPQELPREFGLNIYTGTQAVEAGRWSKVGHDPTPVPPELTLRIVGQEVYQEDEALRLVTQEDLKVLPHQRIAGAGAAESQIQQILTGRPSV
ncbi:hypothetical protein BO221_20305 [Archangium sp. Cb G35]|uniref:hypothetical protein n=1 Tax=Archangium sp. Cb G35 TaxID=1920190 RepID=UPI0009365702|nr:hypothetical protein [Archangium sp. Cb G35]OJT23212.1 hypothetical protein BO221_20305 [Archangium sp. Cb G35]